MMSLFDFLGKPAGKDLGNQVYQFASTNKIKTITKEVSNPKYKGKVMMYPKSFLEIYFENNQEHE